MASRTATVIIEPHLLVREALEALMGAHAYRVVCGVSSTAEIDNPSIVGDGAKLVILGAQSADQAVAEASSIRGLWPDSKIVLLFEHASPADFQKLLASQIDGCVPLFASPDTLISTLDLIAHGDVRVMVVADTRHPSIQPERTEEPQQPEAKVDKSPSTGNGPDSSEREAISITMVAMQHTQRTMNGTGTPDLDTARVEAPCVPPLRHLPKLSEREAQILDGLVKGYANKVIARTCDITEATVKVHMKSILRKIQVANRTQAAIWALEHGYPADELKTRLL